MLNDVRSAERQRMALWGRAGHIAERNVDGKRFLVNALRRRHSVVQVAGESAAESEFFRRVGALPWKPCACHDARRTLPFREISKNFREGRVGGAPTCAYVLRRPGPPLARPGPRSPRPRPGGGRPDRPASGLL